MAKIGFIGLGQMGSGMCRNLIKGGHQLKVYDCAEAAIQNMVDAGAEAATSARAAAEGAEAVFTMLPIGDIVYQTVFGPDGIAEGISNDAIYVDMSTILPEETRNIGRKLAEQGVAMVDAPVGRTSAHAVAGTSTFMVGGDKEHVQRVMPYLECMGECITHCGPLGTGATVKLVNNYISAVCNLVTAEGMALGLAAGADQDTMVEVISQTPAGLGHIKTTWPAKALADDPSPAFMLDLARKDLGLALTAAADAKVPLATGSVTREIYNIASAAGHGREDWTTGIYRTVKHLANAT
jgi:4-hydroxybutyrate dehydrogenase/sulfolactaldehyde 3-reductase